MTTSKCVLSNTEIEHIKKEKQQQQKNRFDVILRYTEDLKKKNIIRNE